MTRTRFSGSTGIKLRISVAIVARVNRLCWLRKCFGVDQSETRYPGVFTMGTWVVSL
jgi:hypothetical protein